MEKIKFDFEVFKESVKYLIANNVTDIHIAPGAPPYVRQAKKLNKLKLPALDEETNEKVMADTETMFPNDTLKFVTDLINYSQSQNPTRAEELLNLIDSQEIDTTLSINGVSRFRVHISMQRHSISCAIRVVPSKIPDFKGMPVEVRNFAHFHNGLVIISGKTNSGKSTTLATLITAMNDDPIDRRKIITLEDPIEYLFKHNNSLIIQREIGTDTKNYKTGLLSALREDPDVLVIGELRDVDSFEIALNAAESGVLVIATMHSSNTREAIERLVSMFPDEKQNQIKTQLATVLKGVISQQLLPCEQTDFGSKLVAAFEVMTTNSAIASAISRGQFREIPNIIETNRKNNMRLMKDSLVKLRESGLISETTFLERNNSIDMYPDKRK